MNVPRLGIALHPDRAFLAAHRELIEDEAELFEVVPESLWDEGCAPSPAHRLFVELRARSGRPFVAHGTLFSLGAVPRPARRDAWLLALRRDRDVFGWEWFSEHLGVCDGGGVHTALPLPLPACGAAVDAVCAAIAELRELFSLVLVENNVPYFALGAPDGDLTLLRAATSAPGTGLVLDLHNAWTWCRNAGLDLAAWLRHVDLDRVVEIHLSGGSDSDPAWLPSRRVMRLDSHDARVPEPVWEAFAGVVGRCRALRAVVLEQVPEAVDAASVRGFRLDFARAREILRARELRTPDPAPSPTEPIELDAAALAALQAIVARACLSVDPPAELARAGADAAIAPLVRGWLAGVDADQLRIAALLVQKLRFERITRGDTAVREHFARDPGAFTREFSAYARSVLPELFPAAEARAFAAFVRAG